MYSIAAKKEEEEQHPVKVLIAVNRLSFFNPSSIGVGLYSAKSQPNYLHQQSIRTRDKWNHHSENSQVHDVLKHGV